MKILVKCVQDKKSGVAVYSCRTVLPVVLMWQASVKRYFAPTLMKYGARDRLDAIPQSIVSESSITLSLCINSYYLMLLYYSLGTEFS